MKPCILLMGICGTGKSTIGKHLSERLQIPFIEGDDFHPEANIVKMKNKEPLNDQDRWPWLERLADVLKENQHTGCVLACSALKESYRKVLQSGLKHSLKIVFLTGESTLIAERMQQRAGHFMPADLIRSQLADLEIPSECWTFNIADDPQEMIEQVVEKLAE